MPFIFTNAALLAALAGLGIPIAIHLLMKRRQVRMKFSTIRFFQQQDPQAKARRKLRNLLLLLLRLLAFSLVVLAFARPFFRRDGASPGQRQRRQVVVVLDRSLSLGAKDSKGVRWDNALAATRRLVGSLGADDRVALVSCAARAEVLSGFAPPAVVAAKLSALAPEASTGDLADGLREATRLVATGDPSYVSSVSIVSDFQRNGALGLDTAPVAPGLTVETVPVGDVLAPNLAVSDLQFDVGETNRPYTTLASHADEDTAAANVEFLVDGQSQWKQTVALPAGATTNLDLRLPRLAAGWHRAEVRLGNPDGLAADNRRFATFNIPPSTRVLAIEGRRGVRSFQEQTFFATAALDPELGTTNAGTGRYLVEKATPEEAVAKLRARVARKATDPGTTTAAADARAALPYDVVVMPAQRQPGTALAGALAEYVRAGGGLLVFLGEDTGATEANSYFADLFPARVGKVEKSDTTEPWRMGETDPAATVFAAFRQPGSGNLAIPEFTSRHALLPVADATVLARFDDGAPLLLSRPAGAGRVLLANFSPDTRWTDWPKHKTFVPWLHGATRFLAGRTDERVLFGGNSATTGTEVTLELGAASKGVSFGIKPPEGPESSANADDHGTLRFDARMPGIYAVRDDAGRELHRVAANVPASESDLASLRPEEFRQKLVRRESPRDGGIASAMFGGDRNREEFWRVLIAAAIALLVAETLLSNRSSA